MNNKKILILALSLALCSASLVSCGGNRGNEDGSVESTTKVEEKETEQGGKKSMGRGMQGVADGIMNGAETVKNDVVRGANNVKDSITDGSLNVEDATHGVEERSNVESRSESGEAMPKTHRSAVPNSK